MAAQNDPRPPDAILLHELRDAVATARVQLDVLRRRLARDGPGDDLDAKLAAIRASLDKALGRD